MLRALWSVLLIAASAGAQTISDFESPVSGGPAFRIAAGPDGNLWFTQRDGIGRITPLGIATHFAALHSPISLSPIAGPNRTVWYAWSGGIDGIDVDTGAITAHATPFQPAALLSGPDGNIWFGYSGGIGRMTPSGTTTLFPMAGSADGIRQAFVSGLATGADGNVWFTEANVHGLGWIAPSTGTIRYLGIPAAGEVVEATDGAIWFMNGGHALSRLERGSEVVGLAFDNPVERGFYATLTGLAAGTDGQVWFSTARFLIGNASIAGMRTLSVDIATLTDVALGPDGNIWVARQDNYICLLSCLPPPDPAPVALFRVNLVNPSPAITGVELTAGGLVIHGLGFVPDTAIRLDSHDVAVQYISPFEIELASAAGLPGGALVAVNRAPGGGSSAPFLVGPVRRRAAR